MGAWLTEAPAVAHAMRGRVRFELSRSLLDPRKRAGISALLSSEPRVLRFRWNVRARSLVVEHAIGLRVRALRRMIASAEPCQPADRQRRGRSRHAVSLAMLAAGTAAAAAGAAPLAAPLIGLGAAPIFRRAAKGLSNREVGVDLLDATAFAITALSGQWVTAALMGGLVEGGEFLRDLTASRSRRELGALMSHQSAVTWKIVDGRRISVSVSSVRAGDQVVVTSGDRVPVDAIVTSGRAVLDERFLTGEAMPVTRTSGDSVFAMTIVTDGELMLEATGSATESRAGRIMAFLEKAPIGETRMADHARRIADRFVLPVMGAGAVVYALTGNPSRAAAVLIFDLSTGIRVAAPTTMLASLIAAAREGILIKGAGAMEKLAAVDTVVFDKTGTLTMGQPAIAGITTFNGMTRDRLLAVAAGADHGLNHPLAAALVAEANRRGVDVPARTRTRYHVGLGVEAELDPGGCYLVGNRAFLRERGVRIPPRINGHGLSEVIVASDDECLGAIVFRDEPRPEASATIDELRRRGVRRIVLLSGDHEPATRRVAEALAIGEWAARMSPEQKADYVRALKHEGRRVAVVGDGVNDSIAMSHAYLSVAMGNGADVASATSEVILLEDRLELLPRAIDRSRQSLSLMNQNIAVIAAPNAIGLGGAIAGGMNPAVAAFLNNGSAVVAAANGLRPLFGRRPGSESRRRVAPPT